MRLVRISLTMSQSLPQDDEDSGLTYSNRPSFGAEAEIEEGEDGDEVAEQLYKWVRWHFHHKALGTHRQHRRLLRRGVMYGLGKFLEKHPKPPSFG